MPEFAELEDTDRAPDPPTRNDAGEDLVDHCLEWAPPIVPTTTPAAGSDLGWQPVVHHTLTAEPAACRTARRLLAEWMCALSASPDLGEDLSMAVGEAVANAVDHAYVNASRAGDVELLLSLGHVGQDHQQWIVIAVVDHGSWRPVPSDSGYRGRGLRMIDAFTEQRKLVTDDHGTTVTMASVLR